MKLYPRILIFSSLIIVSLACGLLHNVDNVETNDEWLPPSTFKESDLIGTWRNDWGEGPSAEIITFRADKSFTQTYTIHSTGQKYEAQGSWWIENGSDGCKYIHADKMQNYELGIRSAQNGNRDINGEPEKFWDICQKQFIEMADFVLLGIGSDNNQEPPIFLYHMAIDQENTSTIFWRISAP
jgi:hypothetical protein